MYNKAQSSLASRPAPAAKAASSMKKSAATGNNNNNNNIAQMFSTQQSTANRTAAAAAAAAAAPPPKPLATTSANIPKPPPSKMSSICRTSNSSFADHVTAPPVLKTSNPFASDQFAKDHGFDDLCMDDFSDDPLEECGPPTALPSKPLAPGKLATTLPPICIDVDKSWLPSPRATSNNISTSSLSKRSISQAQADIPTVAVKRKCLPSHFAEDQAEEKNKNKNQKKKSVESTFDTMAQVDSMMNNNSKKNIPGGGAKREKTPVANYLNDAPPKKNEPCGPLGLSASSVKPMEGPIELSREQQDVLRIVVNDGQSVFFTGPAGTGKSVLMREIIKGLRKKWTRDPEKLAVTASTGLAACNIGGITLHSFSGIGLGKDDVSTLVKKIRRNPKAKNRWIKTKCLVIDEISMVDGDLFDKLDEIARKIRNNPRPWGGIQLVLTGDFFQLPPVPEGGRMAKFSFEAATWGTSIDHTIGLTQVFRQKDPEFANMLNEMRLGRISDRTVQAFKALQRPLNFNDGLDTTELFPTRNEVDSANLNRLQNLEGATHKFDAYDTGEPSFRDKILNNMMCPKVLELKVGAQVMLIKNKDDGQLFNGLIGKVVSFKTELEWGYAITKGEVAGEAYLQTTFEKTAKKFKNAADGMHDGIKYPVVEFPIGDHGIPIKMHCVPEEWKVELPNGEIQATRSQVPLILAWALSIHKAQGQTLDRVSVNLHKIFEKGQAYVALSRATSQAGLRVLGFEKQKVMAHPKVTVFYNQLYSVDKAVKRQAHITDAFRKAGSEST